MSRHLTSGYGLGAFLQLQRLLVDVLALVGHNHQCVGAALLAYWESEET